jgi:CBS domain-containing protein
VPVLDDNGQVLGLVSMRDVVSRYAVAHDLPADADENVLDDDIDADEEVAFTRLEHEPCAGDAMHTEFLSVGPETSLPSVAQRMVELRAHRALVVRQRRLLGLVSTMDLLRVMSAPSPAMA